jgi:hypothetical protein
MMNTRRYSLVRRPEEISIAQAKATIGLRFGLREIEISTNTIATNGRMKNLPK